MKTNKLFSISMLFACLTGALIGCGGNPTTNPGGDITSTPIGNVVPENEVNVIVLAGQSNAEGNSSAKNIEAYCKDTGNSYEEYVRGYNDVKITFHNHYYYGTSFLYSNRENPFEANYVDVKIGQGKAVGWSGPELGMAQYIHDNTDANKPVYIIKFASGGTSFSGTPSWKATNGELYTKMVKYVTNGLEELTSQGLSPKLRAFCWMQGESDSGSASAANAYKASMKNMVNSFRSNFASYADDNNGNNISVVDAHIANTGAWKQHAVINSAKEALKEEMENYYTIDTNSTGIDLKVGSLEHGGGDQYHYTIDSIIKLGNAFGKTIVDNNVLKYNSGTLEDTLKDFSVDDGVTRSNVLKFEAEKGIRNTRSKIVVENNGQLSGGACLGYFWETSKPFVKFIVESDKDESNAIISVALASAQEKVTTELTRPMYKTRMVTVNGEDIRINGTMPVRGSSWYEFKEYSGFMNLKKGINVIEVHHDYNQAYTVEEARVNFDYIKVATKDAKVLATTNNIVEAEASTLDIATLDSVNANSPSNASCVTNLKVSGASITGKFEASKANKAGLFAAFGLNNELNGKDYLKLEVNNKEVAINDLFLNECSLDITKGYDWREFLLAELDLVEGENTFKLTTTKEGFDIKVDYFRICSVSNISVEALVKGDEYKFECEDSSHFTLGGTAKVVSGDGASGGSYIGSMSVNVSSITFKFNAEKDTKILLKVCFGLALDFNMEDAFNMYITNSAVTKQPVTSFNVDIPGSTTNQWFNWTVITLGYVDVKAGANEILFDHPDKSKYATNLDYFVVEADCVIS